MLICHYILFILFWNNAMFNRLWMIHHNKQLQKMSSNSKSKKKNDCRLFPSVIFTRDGVNQMFILSSFQLFTVKTSIPQSKLKKTFVSYGQLCAHGTYLQVSFLGSADSNFNLYYSSLFGHIFFGLILMHPANVLY